jgi:uridine kinase
MGTHCSICKIIAITGPTASGKSSLAKKLNTKLGSSKCVIIAQDNYYKNWGHLNKTARKKINFDDAKAFDSSLLAKHLSSLKRGLNIESPLYDFVQSRRLKRSIKIESKPLIIVEGLMPFLDKKLRSLFDYKIYINVSNGVCLARRIKRDTKERGDSIESVCIRYFNDVLPMQRKYVEPQKKWADLIING